MERQPINLKGLARRTSEGSQFVAEKLMASEIPDAVTNCRPVLFRLLAVNPLRAVRSDYLHTTAVVT